MKITKLNQHGSLHYVVPLAVIVLVGLVGARLLTQSHADTVTLTTDATTTLGNNMAVLGPQNTTGVQVAQSSVPYTLMGYQKVNLLGSGQSLSYTNGIKGDVQACFGVYVQQPKAGTAVATLQFANNNNVKTVTLKSDNTNNVHEFCVMPGTTTNPGFAVKNATPVQQNVTVEVLNEMLRW